MAFPKISIVVPSYNQGQYLEDTLLSIINQQYPGLELFVVDGGSTDNSFDVIKKYEKYINWWVSEKDKGQSEAINKGFKKASGEIITWVNSDDLLTAGALNKVAEYFHQAPVDTGLIYGGTIVFDPKKEIRTDWGYEDLSIERNLAGMAFSQPSAFFSKKYLNKVGGTVREDLHYGMDYDLYSRLACVSRFQRVNDIFSKYRLHSESKSIISEDKFIDDWNRVFVNICKNLGWTDLLDELRKSVPIDPSILEYYYEFIFEPNQQLIGMADKKKILFYHLTYMFRSFYLEDNRIEARKLLKQIKDKFPSDWLKHESKCGPILRRLAIPDFILTPLKRIKRII